MAEHNRLLEEILLLETSSFKEDSSSGVITLEGVFQLADQPNANRRVYPLNYLLREIERLKPVCESRALLGELDHPFYPDENEAAIVHLGNVSHVISKLWDEGATIYGRLEVINTPSGLILQEFIKRNLQVGVSSRSLGSVTERANGFSYVDDNLKILTFDVVCGPSVVTSKLKQVTAIKEWIEVQNQLISEKMQEKVADTGDIDSIDYEELRYFIRKSLKGLGL